MIEHNLLVVYALYSLSFRSSRLSCIRRVS